MSPLAPKRKWNSQAVQPTAVRRILLATALTLSLWTFAVQSTLFPGPQAGAPGADQKELVKLYIGALDRSGHAVVDLHPEELKVVSGKHEAKVESLALASAEPLTVGLAVDVSGSARDELRGVNWTFATQFFQQTLRARDFGFVLAFSDRRRFVSDLTGDVGALGQAVVRLSETLPVGPTALYDAVDWACRSELGGRSGERILVVLSDGGDNSSHLSLSQAVAEVQSAGVTIWTVDPVSEFSFPEGQREWRRGAKALEELAHETGGSALRLHDNRELGDTFRLIAGSLRSQYVIAFLPEASAARGKVYHLKIETTRPGIIVRAPAAYYLPKN